MPSDELRAWCERVGSSFAERLVRADTDAERALVLADLRELFEAAGADPRSGLTERERARWAEEVDGRLEHLAVMLDGRPSVN